MERKVKIGNQPKGLCALRGTASEGKVPRSRPPAAHSQKDWLPPGLPEQGSQGQSLGTPEEAAALTWKSGSAEKRESALHRHSCLYSYSEKCAGF